MANINFLVYNIVNTLSRDNVVRINKMFTKGKILWSFIKFSPIILKGNVWGSVRRICLRILGIKRLTLPECLSLTLLALRVISINFLLVISMLCKTVWSWELRAWSHKMNIIDTSTNSPHYFYWKRIGITHENLNFDVRV